MPSFDLVSEIDLQEVRNAVENAEREVTNRWDFRNATADIVFNEKNNNIKMTSESEFQVQQLLDIVRDKLLKRGIEHSALLLDEQIEHSGKLYSQTASLQQGIDSAQAKKIVKLIKDGKLKVQTQIQGEQVRITGKSRDELQQAIALLKQTDLGQPLQFINFRQ